MAVTRRRNPLPPHYPVLFDPDGDAYHVNDPSQYTDDGKPQTTCDDAPNTESLVVASRSLAEDYHDTEPCETCFHSEPTADEGNAALLPGGVFVTPPEGETYDAEPDGFPAVVLWRDSEEELSVHSVLPNAEIADRVRDSLRDAGYWAETDVGPQYTPTPIPRDGAIVSE